MDRNRATGIVINSNKIMFMQQMVHGKLRHVFVGGGIEENETPEQAILRELKEEANVDGSILYGPVKHKTEYVFVIKINEGQEVILGYDPEIPKDEEQVIKNIVWRDLILDKEMFNEADKEFINAVISQAAEENIQADWLESLKKVLS